MRAILMLRATAASFLCAASCAGFTCLDVGSLSRRNLCYDADDTRTCERLPEELWLRDQDHRPQWADPDPNSLSSEAASRRLLQVGQAVTLTVQINICGDAWLGVPEGEECDDGNLANGDGCDSLCRIEQGYACFPSVTAGVVFADLTFGTTKSICELNSCGDGRLHPTEACDDENVADNDGCSSTCVIEADYFCEVKNQRTVCLPPFCGDGKRATTEECDDGNVAGGDGCDPSCHLEVNAPYACRDTCTSGCHLYVNQRRTLCVPVLQTVEPTPVPVVFTPTLTLHHTDTATTTATFVEEPEAGLTYTAKMMTNIKGPCSYVLEGRYGCCAHLAENHEYAEGAPQPIRDLEFCRWPVTGYRVVHSGSCGSHGHYAIQTVEECTAAAVSLALEDLHPHVLSAGADVRALHTINVTLMDKQGNVREYSGVYDQVSHTEYRQRAEYAPGTASMQFRKGWWYLHQTSRAERWLVSSPLLIASWHRVSPDDHYFDTTIPYPRVTEIGERFRPGCNIQRHATKEGQLVWRDHSTNATAGAYGRCTEEVGCVCKLDNGAHLEPQYTPKVRPMCSYLLHQLHCGYSCLARYMPETEDACQRDSDCSKGGVCAFLPIYETRFQQLEQELQDALAREAEEVLTGKKSINCAIPPCKTSDQARVDIVNGRQGIIGSCRGTGAKVPPCEDWLTKVYDACRMEPVSFVNWTDQLAPPLPHCQPLWWKYRTYADFRQAFMPGDDINTDECWSPAAPPPSPPLLLLLCLGAALVSLT